MDNRERLKAKLQKKKKERTQGVAAAVSDFTDETDIVKMMENVNNILRTNPQMVQQVSKCVSKVMKNKDLMSSLMGQIQDQTRDNKEELESNLASPNE